MTYTLTEIELLSQAHEIIMELCQLKSYKDNVGKDSLYLKDQPIAWAKANQFLNSMIGYNWSGAKKEDIQPVKMGMGKLRNLLNQLDGEEISMSKFLEEINNHFLKPKQ